MCRKAFAGSAGPKVPWKFARISCTSVGASLGMLHDIFHFVELCGMVHGVRACSNWLEEAVDSQSYERFQLEFVSPFFFFGVTRPCRDNKRDSRQMLTAALVPSRDGLDASFRLRRVWLVCPHTAVTRRRRFTGAVFTRAAPWISNKVDLLQRSRDPAEKPSNYQRLSEHHAPHKDKSQTSMSPVAKDAH